MKNKIILLYTISSVIYFCIQLYKLWYRWYAIIPEINTQNDITLGPIVKLPPPSFSDFIFYSVSSTVNFALISLFLLIIFYYLLVRFNLLKCLLSLSIALIVAFFFWYFKYAASAWPLSFIEYYKDAWMGAFISSIIISVLVRYHSDNTDILNLKKK